VEVYEQTTFGFDRLTSYQQSKMEQCSLQLEQGVPVHLQAAAGTGKTFIGIHFLLDQLRAQPESKALFVTPNMTLALFVIRWIGKRIDGKEERDDVLSRLHVSYSGAGAADSVAHWRTLSNTVSGVGAFKKSIGSDLGLASDDTEWYREVLMRKALGLKGPLRIVLEDVDSDSFIRLRDLEPSEAAAGALSYGLTVVDEAHHVLRNEDNATAVQRWASQGGLLLLSDISQTSAKDLSKERFPEAANVELTKVIRSSKRIVAAAMAFQTNQSSQATCGHCDIAGPPLKPFLFAVGQGEDLLDATVAHSVAALQHITGMFPSLNLHNRVVLLVPNEEFRVKFTHAMQQRVEAEVDLRHHNIKFVRAHEAAAIADFEKRLNAAHAETLIVIDEVSEFDGLERLFVIAVNLDAKVTDAAAPESRSQLYRAITRAHMMVLVVNVVIENGWLSFLCHVEFNTCDEFSEEAAVTQCDSQSVSAALSAPSTLDGSIDGKRDKESATGTADVADEEPLEQGAGRSDDSDPSKEQAVSEAVPNEDLQEERSQHETSDAVKISQRVWDVSGLKVAASKVPQFMPIRSEAEEAPPPPEAAAEMDVDAVTELVAEIARLNPMLTADALMGGVERDLDDPSRLSGKIGWSEKGIEKLPENLDALAGSHTLSMSKCGKLASLPEGFRDLKNLKQLDLTSCKSLVSLPKGFGELRNLVELNLEECTSLLSLPAGIHTIDPACCSQ
jgi:hypothetical protein